MLLLGAGLAQGPGEWYETIAPRGCSMARRLQHRHPGLRQEAGRGSCARCGHRSPGRTRLYVLLALVFLAWAALLLVQLRARRGASAPSVARSPVPRSPAPDPALAARVRQLESAVTSAPSDVDARLRLAEAYLEAQRPLDAVAALEQVPAEGGRVNLVLGRAYADAGNVEAAEDHLRAAHEAMPEGAEATSRLGLFLAGTGRLDEGIALCRQAVAEHPDDYDALVRLARVRILSRDLGRRGQQEARPMLMRAIQLRPDGAEAYALMARVQLLYPDEAVEYATKAVELDPRCAEGYEVLGWLYCLRPSTPENVRLAEEALLKGLALRPDQAILHFRLGLLYGRAGRAQESVRQLEEALALAPSSLQIRYALASAYKRAGRNEEAAEIRRYVRMESDYREQEARRRLDVAYAPDDADAYARMAEFYLKYGKNRLAALAAGRALALDPHHQAAARILRAAGGVVP